MLHKVLNLDGISDSFEVNDAMIAHFSTCKKVMSTTPPSVTCEEASYVTIYEEKSQ